MDQIRPGFLTQDVLLGNVQTIRTFAPMTGMEPAMPCVGFNENCILNSSYINQGNES